MAQDNDLPDFPELAGLPASPHRALARLWQVGADAARSFAKIQSQGVPPPDGHPDSRRLLLLYFASLQQAERLARGKPDLLPQVRSWVHDLRESDALSGTGGLRTIFAYRLQVLWLTGVARLIEEDAHSDLLGELEFELAHFEKVLRLARKGAKRKADFLALRKELGEARRESLFKRGERLLALAGWQAPESELERVQQIGPARTSRILDAFDRRAADPFASLAEEVRKRAESGRHTAVDNSPERLWDRYLEAVDIVTEIRRLPDVHKPGPGLLYLTRNLERLEEREAAALVDAWAALSEKRQRALFIEWTNEVLDRSAEVMAAPLDRDPATESISQAAAFKIAEHLRGLGQSLSRDLRKEQRVKDSLRALDKSLGRLRNERQETGLNAGLHRWFGPVGRAALEVVVLVATLLAVVLIFTQLYWLDFPDNAALTGSAQALAKAEQDEAARRDELSRALLALRAPSWSGLAATGRPAFELPSVAEVHALTTARARFQAAQTERALTAAQDRKLRNRRRLEVSLNWFDAVLCLVLLGDFTLRFLLVRGKTRYFLRHVLVDVIPAIPFGLLIDTLEGMAEPGTVGFLKFLVFVRLSKLAPVLRTVRPLVRLARVGAFALRGMDRMVRNLRRHLDRDIVLFGQASARKPSCVELLRREEHRARRRVRNHILAGGEDERLADFLHWIRQVRSVVRAYRVELDDVSDLGPIAAPPIQLRSLVRTLLNLTPSEVEEVLGPVMVRRLGNWISLLDSFVIRRLPIVRDLVKNREALSASALIARGCRVVGKILQKLQAKIEWLADLHGIASGPQVLDWVGQTMVKSTERPAKRLILFGLGLFFANILFGAFGLSLFNKLAAFLQKALGTPIIVIGVLCAFLMGIGRWFRWIAGEASDVYFRVAEAQYLNLTEIYRYARSEDDLAALRAEVIGPEERIASRDLPRGLLEKTVAELQANSPRRDEELGGLHDLVVRVAYLYRDHLDGSPLHMSDTKATEQLLGNLTVRSIIEERLRFTDKDRKRLERVDLARARSLFGPYIWFNMISRSLMEQTAKLLMEYNRFAVPVAERDHVHPPVLERFRTWLAGRSTAALRDRKERRRVDRERQQIRRFQTSYFDALHFLTIDPNREAALEHKFGAEVMASVRQDRREMVRSVFGTFPFEVLPPTYRVINFYRLYMGTMAGGRVLFLPLRVLFFGLRLVGFGFRQLKRVIVSILRPSFDAADAIKSDSFEIARRKIKRLKQPSFIEALRLRAAFDPEYLGCHLPGLPRVYGRRVGADLDLIGAFDEVFEEAELLREDREQALSELAELYAADGGPAQALGVPASREVLRAVALAWACDYRGMRTLWNAAEQIRQSLAAPTSRKLERWPSWVRSLKVKRAALRSWLTHNPDADKRAVKRCFRKDGRFSATIACMAYHNAFEAPREKARKLLGEVARSPLTWTEQLVSLRALQTLFVRQLEEYFAIVRQLGEYDDGSRAPKAQKRRTLRSLRVRTDF